MCQLQGKAILIKSIVFIICTHTFYVSFFLIAPMQMTKKKRDRVVASAVENFRQNLPQRLSMIPAATIMHDSLSLFPALFYIHHHHHHPFNALWNSFYHGVKNSLISIFFFFFFSLVLTFLYIFNNDWIDMLDQWHFRWIYMLFFISFKRARCLSCCNWFLCLCFVNCISLINANGFELCSYRKIGMLTYQWT